MSEGTQERVERRRLWVCPECGHHEDMWLWDDRDAAEKGSPACPIDGCYGTVMEVREYAPAHLLDTAIKSLRELVDAARAVNGVDNANSQKRQRLNGAIGEARSTLTKLERGTGE